MFGSAESKRPTLTNREIIFEEFQPTYVITIHHRHRQTDGQTDGRTKGQMTCDRKTALCTVVHRAVKTDSMQRKLLIADQGR